MLHGKAVIFDNQLAVIGSANRRPSLFLNYEVALFLYSREHVEVVSAWATHLQGDCLRELPKPGWTPNWPRMLSVCSPRSSDCGPVKGRRLAGAGGRTTRGSSPLIARLPSAAIASRRSLTFRIGDAPSVSGPAGGRGAVRRDPTAQARFSRGRAAGPKSCQIVWSARM